MNTVFPKQASYRGTTGGYKLTKSVAAQWAHRTQLARDLSFSEQANAKLRKNYYLNKFSKSFL
jgi:glutathionyl-hydroquinone reductase